MRIGNTNLYFQAVGTKKKLAGSFNDLTVKIEQVEKYFDIVKMKVIYDVAFSS